MILPIVLKKDEIDYIKTVFNNNLKVIYGQGNIVNWFENAVKKNYGNNSTITVKPQKQEIYCCNKVFHFDIDKAKKYKIINQIDTISEILKKEKLIADFEKNNEI